MELNEKAPPTKKHERMVKHIKKSYKKDGKLTDAEKSIAYATAWKDYNKESFEIDPKKHNKAKKLQKLRNLALGNRNPNEKEAAEKKAGGPKLMGEGILDRLKPKKKEDKKPEIPTGAEKKIRDWRKKRKQAEHEKYVNFLPVDEKKTWDQFKKHI